MIGQGRPSAGSLSQPITGGQINFACSEQAEHNGADECKREIGGNPTQPTGDGHGNGSRIPNRFRIDFAIEHGTLRIRRGKKDSRAANSVSPSAARYQYTALISL